MNFQHFFRIIPLSSYRNSRFFPKLQSLITFFRMIILISGKRKSGKDYIAERLRDTFAADSRIIRLSAPLKSAYAKENGLDYQELLSSGPYKEKHRRAMIEWGEEKRNQDPGYFCRLAWGDTGGEQIVIVADCRRKTDFDHFQHQQSCLTVRVKAR